MSQDYPDYIRTYERSRLLGWAWRIGDIGYYIGLLGAVIAASFVVTVPVIAFLMYLIGADQASLVAYWRRLPTFLVLTALCIGILFGGLYTKSLAYRRSGIENRLRSPEDGREPNLGGPRP